MSAWVYVRTEPGVWTVGFYDPDGRFQTDSDHHNREEAVERASYLNGTHSHIIDDLLNKVSALTDAMDQLYPGWRVGM